tara:strand:+ start:310 stop:489 length:180 start_codon:yes stop_codon:yes gene_type:complete
MSKTLSHEMPSPKRLPVRELVVETQLKLRSGAFDKEMRELWCDQQELTELKRFLMLSRI